MTKTIPAPFKWEYMITAQGAQSVGAPEFIETDSADRARRAEKEYRAAGVDPLRFKRKAWPNGRHTEWRPC